jgi:Xaa-Pro aminopeptidase
VNWSFPPWYHLVPAEVILPRLERIARMCRRQGLAAMLITDAYDVFYACGSGQQGLVLVTAGGQASVLMRRHAGRAAAECPLPVTPITGLTQAAGLIKDMLPDGGRLGATLDVMSAADFLGWQKRLPGLNIVDASGPWLDLKAIKDPWEIERMRSAGELAASLCRALPGLLRPGISEAELAGELQRLAMAGGSTDYLRSRQAYQQTYSWHICSGPEGGLPSAMDAPCNGWGLSPAFPLGASHRRIQPGEPVNVDFGVNLEGYQTDQTRTFCLGPAPQPLQAAHACLAEIEAALIEGLVPGAVSGELFDLALGIARQHGLGEEFLARGSGHGIRFCAHGMGQEIGAPPYILQNSRALARAGETYALELKMVLPLGPVGLENTVLVTENGPAQNLVPLPSELVEVPL